MPIVSKAQNAAMHAAAQGKSTLGIPKSVGQEFVAAGPKPGALPARAPSAPSPKPQFAPLSGLARKK